MDKLTAFGLLAVTAMLICYAFEKKNTWFIFGFAVACLLGSVYGFLRGVAIWSYRSDMVCRGLATMAATKV